jgi:hypothetical protein
VGDDGAVECVPGAAEGARVVERQRGVGGLDARVLDVDALRVGLAGVFAEEEREERRKKGVRGVRRTYLFCVVVFVPFHAVIAPPHPRRLSSEDWIHAVPKPYRKSTWPAISLAWKYALASLPM